MVPLLHRPQYKNEVKRSHFQSKAYRIEIVYALAFEACANVYGKEKTELLMALIKSGLQVDLEKIKVLPQLTKNILLEEMLDRLMNKEIPIEKLRYIFREKKILNLYDLLADKYEKMEVQKPTKAFRILPSYQGFIMQYSRKRLGETLELAIALFINDSSDFEYELIITVYKYILDNNIAEENLN